MEKKDLLANYAASKQNMCITNDTISDRLFQEYGVNRGLRDVNGKGVLTGLTRISKIVSFKDENGKQVPCDGELWYRGYNVKTLIKSIGPNEFGFEKAAYLLLFGELPDQAQLDEFCEVLGNSRTLPTNFTRDVIMKAPSKDIMNSMTRSILTLAAYDPYTTDSSIENNIRQCMQDVHQLATEARDAGVLLRQADDYFVGKREAAKNASSLTELDAMITQLLTYKDNICRRMEVMSASHQERTTPVGTGTAQPAPKMPKITTLRRYDLCSVKRLQSKEDIDRYVDGIREKLLKTLESCDGVQIN